MVVLSRRSTPVLSKLIEFLGRRLARLRGTALGEDIARRIRTLDRLVENEDYRADENGEAVVLRKLAELPPRCVFDVGANVGEYSLRVARLYPQAQIYAFEPMPDTFSTLQAATARLPNIVCTRLALGDAKAMLRFHRSAVRSDTDTAFPVEGSQLPKGHYTHAVEAPVERGEDFMSRHGVTEIDLLKIDVEGMDLRVIRGFGAALARVRVLQFEYGVFNAGSHDLLGDFFAWLEAHGFVVGRIFPYHVQFGAYQVDMEQFVGGNYLAVRRDAPRLIQRLANRARS